MTTSNELRLNGIANHVWFDQWIDVQANAKISLPAEQVDHGAPLRFLQEQFTHCGRE